MDFIIFVADELTREETSKDVCVDPWDPKLYGKESTKQYDVKEETAMREKFEQWMKEYNKTYRTEKEKAMRYERFKIACMHVANPNEFGNWTPDEYKSYNKCEGFDMEEYNAYCNSLIEELGTDEHIGVTSSPEMKEYLLKKAADCRRRARNCYDN